MNFNVLVVNDSQVMRTMIVRTLRMCGLPLGQVYEAGDGAAFEGKLRGRAEVRLIAEEIFRGE